MVVKGMRLNNIWADMKARCQNINQACYPRYGGRGIKVCEEWQEFIPFYNWAMANGYSDELTLDRKDNDGNYEPDNCRWATPMKQANNRRNTFWIEINGVKKSATEWSRETGVSAKALRERWRRGLRGDDLLHKKKYYMYPNDK